MRFYCQKVYYHLKHTNNFISPLIILKSLDCQNIAIYITFTKHQLHKYLKENKNHPFVTLNISPLPFKSPCGEIGGYECTPKLPRLAKFFLLHDIYESTTDCREIDGIGMFERTTLFVKNIL